MVTPRWTAAPAQAASSRRRGAVLERAILDAALEQLSTVGWSGLTMEGVAAGAQTGKAAVYRRWPSKEALVADALRVGLPSFEDAPDLGSVREDLLALCRAAREAMYSRPGFAVRSVIHECDPAEAEQFHGVIFEGIVEPTVRLLREVINRGIARGEVRSDAADDHVFDAIPAMLMYRSKMYGCEWSDRELEEMVDRFALPLLRPGVG
ncbi:MULTISPECIES: TetR/AcrR family transcriptional regulator [Streptomyces]|uniref:TetR/AcrR family transcriptional regulator n=1 Tax=Streptomyces doudnae TaxID=3075536 RepID=A0ABD5EXF1_9ACTN|nr:MULTISPECIES: TetR/AcrR family transcriptional regulator [unclassified Streptomyces]MDT0438852.1 TetR/AcrR family transcriptional regulator [Streptomyces sp. DSM 41981]MYQ66656.1 TetR family transcriptional regulator [Streptomyces sp. SID4950]SCE23435.1 transcriptional regulator, TetR family [Streptomyces sp. SolWspMP-5a-2]